MSSCTICNYKHQDGKNHLPSLRVQVSCSDTNFDFKDRQLAFVWKEGVSGLAGKAGLTRR